MALHIKIMYFLCNIVLLLLIGIYHFDYVSGDDKLDHTNIAGFPKNPKDTKSLDVFQTQHNHLDKRSKGMNYLTSSHRKFGESFYRVS